MAKTKTKQIGEAIKGLNANANTNSNLIDHDLASVNLNAYHQTNPTDYQIAPVDLPEESAVDTTLQDLVAVADDAMVADEGANTPELILEPNSDPFYPRPSEPVITDPVIIGGGNDTMQGGADSDTFALNASNFAGNLNGIDTIIDFVSGVDKIAMTLEFYQSSTGYSVSFDGYTQPTADELVQGAGAVALDANDHFIFDTYTGALYFDSDGNGSGEAVQFAILQGVTQLSVNDFLPYEPYCKLPQLTILPEGLIDAPPPPSRQQYYDSLVAENPDVQLVGIDGMIWPWV